MKKFTFLVAALIVATIVNAQGFYKAIELGGMFGLDNYGNKSFEATFIGGYSVTPKFMVGAGVGFRYTDALYYTSYMHTSVQSTSSYYESRSQEYLIPIYARIKYNFSDRLIAPFVQGSVGYAFNIGGQTKAVSGLCFEPAVGIDFNLRNKQSVYVSIGYNLQKSQYTQFTITSYEQSDILTKGYANTISVRLGFKF